MVKEAPSAGRMIAMIAFALSCVGILLYLWLVFGGSVPLRPEGYRFKVKFPEATQLAQEADVRISGVNVGKVKTKEPDRGDRPDRGRDRDRRAVRPAAAGHQGDPAPEEPARRDLRGAHARATARARCCADGGRLPAGQVSPTVELDEIFRALRPQDAPRVLDLARRAGAGGRTRAART